MKRRLAVQRVRTLLGTFPAIVLVGPRQSGKTTLARKLAKTYYDLEQPSERLRLDIEWEKIQRSRSLVILDEAQVYPEVFPRLRGAIDQDRKRNGRFLLLGSVSPALMKNVSESLAGRLAVCELTPFLLPELDPKNLDRLWLMGGYPDGGILQKKNFPQWQNHYLEILSQRDLPNWGLPSKPQQTARLFKMLAASHGTIWNASQIGQSLDLNYHTVNSHLDYLEGAFLIRRLAPYFANLQKRIVKSPRVYWRDSGLLHATLGVRNHEELLAQPWVGRSWEGFVIEQILASLQARGISFEAFYLRTGDDYELDLILKWNQQLWAFEIKLSSSPKQEDFGRMRKLAELIHADFVVMISRTEKTFRSGKNISTNLTGLLDILQKAG